MSEKIIADIIYRAVVICFLFWFYFFVFNNKKVKKLEKQIEEVKNKLLKKIKDTEELK